MSEQTEVAERSVRDAVQSIIDILLDFDAETRSRVFRTTQTFFGLDAPFAMSYRARPTTPEQPARGPHDATFGDRTELPPKEFLFQKQPKTDVDRIACLAYYLTHYRDTRHFKTVDISKLNTEAAQVKFSNTAYAVANASNTGLLVPAGKGFKQLSAVGERYVEALPDRDAAREVLTGMKSRRRRKAGKGNANSDD